MPLFLDRKTTQLRRKYSRVRRLTTQRMLRQLGGLGVLGGVAGGVWKEARNRSFATPAFAECAFIVIVILSAPYSLDHARQSGIDGISISKIFPGWQVLCGAQQNPAARGRTKEITKRKKLARVHPRRPDEAPFPTNMFR